MELNKRIKALTDIQSVTNGCHDWKFMTKKGYFANSIFDFKDLERTCVYGEYAGWREHNQCFHCEVILPDGTTDYNWFSYFLLEDSLLPEVKPEKKYRAFTLTEWFNQYEIGQIIHYRCKSPKIELRHMYTGYAYGIGADIEKTTSGTLTLGVASYALDYLFEEYEIEIDGEWQPFGTEVKEE